MVLAVAAPPVAADMTLDQARDYVLGKCNGARGAQGLAPVQADPRLHPIAQSRSDDMATNHYFAHPTD